MSNETSPTKWIIVAGSGVPPFPASIVATSKRLGRELGDAGFGLISGGWPGVDHFVARAFAEAVKEAHGRLSDRLVQFMKRSDTPDFPSGRFVTARSENEAWEKSVETADAVVLIGGLGGTYRTGKMGRKLGKPVLPLADTNENGQDDAHAFYFDLVRDWDRTPVEGLTLSDFQCLSDPAPGVVTELVRLLETLFGSQVHRVAADEPHRLSNKDAALELLEEKPAFLLKEEAIAIDATAKFKLMKDIQDAHNRISRLKGT